MTRISDHSASSIAEAEAWARRHGVTCRIQLPVQSFEVVLQNARDRGVSSFGICSVRQLKNLSHRDADSILVARPQTWDELRTASQCAAGHRLLWAVDHYVQAEQLAATGLLRPQTIVLQLQSPKAGIGIRPGTDALQLAQGIERLAGVTVKGVAIHASDKSEVNSLMQAVQYTRDQLLKHGICCDIVSLCVAEAVPPSDTPVTELHVDVRATTGRKVKLSAPLVATVISRPSLEHAAVVIDGVDAGQCIIFPDHPQLHVLHWHRDCCVVSGADPTTRLNIADRLTVVIQD